MGGLRIVGWLFLCLAFLFFTRDLFAALTFEHGMHAKTFGDIWNIVSPGAPANLEGYMVFKYGRWAWWPIGFIVDSWAFVVLLIPGLTLEILCRPKVDKPGRRAPRGTARVH